jgi:acyl carrier protein
MMKDELKKIMADVFLTDIDKIPDNVSQANFEKWESLQHLMLIVSIESEFGVSFEPEEIIEMTSLELLEKYLASKLASN